MMDALPADIAVTMPKPSTAATPLSEDKNLTYDERVTSRTTPREKVPRSMIGKCSPCRPNIIAGICGAREVGISGLSTRIRIDSDCSLLPDAIAPTAVNMYGLHAAMFGGIVTENLAGTDVATLLKSMGSSPMTATLVNAAPAGDITATEIVC